MLTPSPAMNRFICILLTVVFSAIHAVSQADDGVYNAVSPFAVYVTLDGPGNKKQIELQFSKIAYAQLREARVPTADAKDMKTEPNPYIHFEYWIRGIEETGEYLCIARVNVKVKTKNPFNGTRMNGVLASGLKVESVDSIDDAKKLFVEFAMENTRAIFKAWRSDNPLPGFALPDSGIDGEP